MQRGQSLIVWAIADGRHAAAAVDGYLMGESEPLGDRLTEARSRVAERPPGSAS